MGRCVFACLLVGSLVLAVPAEAQLPPLPVEVTSAGNADTVDHFSASSTPTANTLLPLDADGLLPGSVLRAGSVQLSALASDVATQADLDALDTRLAGIDGRLNGLDQRLDGLGLAGTINAGANPLSWSMLKGVPAGIADGTDAVDGGNASNVTCSGCVSASDVAADLATQAELDAQNFDWRYLGIGQKAVDTELFDGLDSNTFAQIGQLGTPGAINTSSSLVDWTKLKGVPAGIADGTDAVDGGNASNVTCTGCVSASDLAADAATQSELDAHHHDARYAQLGHVHDDRYFTENEFQSGAFSFVNDLANPVHWTRLKGVPSTIADGWDDVDGGNAANLICNACVSASELAPGAMDGGHAFNLSCNACVSASELAPGAVDGGNAANVTCTGCVSASELGGDAATQAELDAVSLSAVKLNPGFRQAGNIAINGYIRLGSETGTTQNPFSNGLGAAYAGIVTRMTVSGSSTAGGVVAKTNDIHIERDGSNGGMRANFLEQVGPGVRTLRCISLNSFGNVAGRTWDTSMTSHATDLVGIVADFQNIVHLDCLFGNPVGRSHQTHMVISRTMGDVSWTGFITSSLNQ